MSYGVPFSFIFDEGQYIQAAVHFGADGPRPTDYKYGPFYSYLIAAVLGAIFVVGRATGFWHSAAAFQRLYFHDPSLFYIASRSISAVSGALAVIAVFAAGRWWLSSFPLNPDSSRSGSTGVVRAGAFFTALALAVAPLPVEFGSRALAESLVLCLISLWLLAGGRYNVRKSLKDLFAAGLFLGLAGATKYNALFFLPWQFALPLVAGQWRRARAWITALAAPAAGFLLGAPFAPADARLILRDLHFNAVVSTQKGGSPVVGFLLDIKSLFSATSDASLGPIVAAAAVLGTVISVRKRLAPWWLATAAWGFVVASAVADPIRPIPRYLLPGVPALLLMAGFGFQWLWTRIEGIRRARVHLNPGVAVALLVLPTFGISLGYQTKLLRQDTRIAARDWIQSHVEPGAGILIEDSIVSPPLAPDSSSINEDPRGPRRARALFEDSTIRYHLGWLPGPWGQTTPQETEQLAREGIELKGFRSEDEAMLSREYWLRRGITIAILSSTVFDRYFRGGGEVTPAYQRFYQEIFRDCRLLHREDPASGGRPGPLILIYDISKPRPPGE